MELIHEFRQLPKVQRWKVIWAVINTTLLFGAAITAVSLLLLAGTNYGIFLLPGALGLGIMGLAVVLMFWSEVIVGGE